MPSYPYPKLELKYCERCGGLWLRPCDTDAVYCAACAEAIRELPPVTRRDNPPSSMQAACTAVATLVAVLLSLAESCGGACA